MLENITRVREERQGEGRDVGKSVVREVVGRLKAPPVLLGYLPFRADRLAHQDGPPLFDPVPYLVPNLRMFFREPAFGRLTSVSPPSHQALRYHGPWSEYMSADRVVMLPARGTPTWASFVSCILKKTTGWGLP